MGVDRGLVGEDGSFSMPWATAMTLTLANSGPAFAPVGVGDDVVAAHFPSGSEFHARRHLPVEQGVVACDMLARRELLDVFEERREAADHSLVLKAVSDLDELIDRDAGFGGPALPRVETQFGHIEFALERSEDAPFESVELNDFRC